MQEMQETQVWFLGWEDALKKEMATHSNNFAWEIHEQRSLVGYSLRVEKSQTWLNNGEHTHTYTSIVRLCMWTPMPSSSELLA